jgi:hypothetical protein
MEQCDLKKQAEAETPRMPFLTTSGGQNSYVQLNVVHFLNTS